MLIANADDVGASLTATDAAIAAFDETLISSCSAMVWMRDSERAGGIVRDHGLPVGLHLNLTLPFDSAQIPAGARERQLRLTECFGSLSWRDDVGREPPRQLIRDAVSDQLSRFAECYGEATHLDGHHHVHVHDAVLEVLPRAAVIRPILREPARADDRLSRRERRLHRRFRAPTLTLALEHLHPDLGGVGFGVLDRARDDWVEVMVHPQQHPQREALRSPEWLGVVSRTALGSYAGLSRSR